MEELERAGENREIALIITGRTMKFVFRSSTRENFMFLSLKCKSVICCRVSPSQKADIVKEQLIEIFFTTKKISKISQVKKEF